MKGRNLFSKPLLLTFNNVKLFLEHLDGFILLHNFNRSTLLESLRLVMPLKTAHINNKDTKIEIKEENLQYNHNPPCIDVPDCSAATYKSQPS